MTRALYIVCEIVGGLAGGVALLMQRFDASAAFFAFAILNHLWRVERAP